MFDQKNKVLFLLQKFRGTSYPFYIILLFITSLVLYHVSAYLLFSVIPLFHEIIFFLFTVIITLVISIIFKIRSDGILMKEGQAVAEEFRFIELIKNHGTEIIILLNRYGQIINYNMALCRVLQIDESLLQGKPFRDLFSLNYRDAGDSHYSELILDKLKTAFQGFESELIANIHTRDSNDIETLHLRLLPVKEDGELQYIFVSGRILQTDYITNKWLDMEKSEYVLDNEIPLIYLFSYRLTRNLDGKLPRSKILFMQIALQEVIINAIEHGNFEIDYETKTMLKQQGGSYFDLLISYGKDRGLYDRRIHVEYRLEQDHVYYRVTDEGSGFDWRAFMRGESSDYGKDLLENFHGVGLQMVKKTFDRILFNEAGNQITLIKYLEDGKSENGEIPQPGANSGHYY